MPTSLSTRSAINRMESVFDLLVNFEDAHDQAFWRKASTASSCGTALCFAGWVAWDSPYEYVIQDLVAFLQETNAREEEEDEYYDSEGLLYSVVAIPPGDVLQKSKLATDDIDDFFKYQGGSVYSAFNTLAGRFPAGTKFMGAGALSAELLHTEASPNVHTYRQDPILSRPLISHKIYNYANSLKDLRYYIDDARRMAGMEPRDFERNPVKVRVDSTTPKKLVPTVHERVAKFNEAAARGVIEHPHVSVPEELLPPLDLA